MLLSSTAEVVGLFTPDADDWVVALHFRDGTVETRRVSPGRLTERQALGYAIAASGRLVAEVSDARLTRVGNASSEVQQRSSEDFERLVARSLNR
jgi:hypothetical protein